MNSSWTLNTSSSVKRDVKYPKYIPIEEGKKGVKFPRNKIDKKAPRCYFDLQTWYIDYLMEKESYGHTKLRQTASETDAIDILKRSDQCNHENVSSENSFLLSDRKSIITNRRFGTKNNRYLQCSCACLNVDATNMKRVEMYIRITKEQLSKLHLFHVKTEMVVKCLQNFFKPFDDTTVMFVSDLNTNIDQGKKNNIKDIFDCFIGDKLKNAKAVLYLDEFPARLLRHKDMCVLDTLATIIEIRKEELLVIPMSTLRYGTPESIER